MNNFKSASLTALVVIVIFGFICQQALALQIRPEKHNRMSHQTYSSKTNDNEDTQVDNYSFDHVWELMYEDLMRWMAIFEDVVAESLREQFFDGIVDRKTVKRALRFFTRNFMSSMKDSGFLSKIGIRDEEGKRRYDRENEANKTQKHS